MSYLEVPRRVFAGKFQEQLMLTPSGRGDGTTAGPSFQLPFPR